MNISKYSQYCFNIILGANMKPVIAFVSLLLLLVFIVGSQGFIRLDIVNPTMHTFRSSTHQNNEMETPKIGHLRMFNHQMHSGKRGDNSDEMFRHFLDYIFQINNDEGTEARIMNKRVHMYEKESSMKRKFRPYSMRFVDRVNTYVPKKQKFDDSLKVNTYEPKEHKFDNSLTNLLMSNPFYGGNRIFEKYFDYVPFWA